MNSLDSSVIDSFVAKPITDLDHIRSNLASTRVQMELLICKTQADFVRALEAEEGSGMKFQVDRWLRPEGGGGITCVIQDGQVFEKAGVNISVVHGKLPPAAVQQMRARGKLIGAGEAGGGGVPFFAAGISSVIHPKNPFVPTVHFNYRCVCVFVVYLFLLT
jgi:coproporphyrinogen III oxidase